MITKGIPVSSWYPTLADYTFPTTFVKLKDLEIELIAKGVEKGEEVDSVVERIKKAQHSFPGRTFVFADVTAPTDTERFEIKKGAVHSAESAWRNIVMSVKVREAAETKSFNFLCIRPFRNLTYPREFRLFIYKSELKLMSQYWQTRHYQRLEGKKNFYWEKAKNLVDEISWLLPQETVVLDIYFTASDRVILIDFNLWGECSPLLAESWDIDWSKVYGIRTL